MFLAVGSTHWRRNCEPAWSREYCWSDCCCCCDDDYCRPQDWWPIVAGADAAVAGDADDRDPSPDGDGDDGRGGDAPAESSRSWVCRARPGEDET